MGFTMKGNTLESFASILADIEFTDKTRNTLNKSLPSKLGFWAMLKRHEKTFLWVYLSVFLLTLFFTEALERNLIIHFPLSFLVGLSTGLAVALIRGHVEETIKNPADLHHTIPLPILGIAPSNKNSEYVYALQTAHDPLSPVAQAFYDLRNNLRLLTQNTAPKILNITSSDASEGKSSTTVNLATAFAQQGRKVLLIDADLRRPTLHKHFELDNTKGLGNYLGGLNKLENVIQPTFIANLAVIPAGPITPHAVELLASERLKTLISTLEQGLLNFDLVLIDSPPVMGLADALLISNRSHATILVAACHQTSKRALVSSYQRLKQAHINLIGTVLTKVSITH